MKSSVIYLSLLSFLLITLKFCDVIDYSWWAVLLPLYGGVLTGIILYIATYLMYIKNNN